MKKFTFIIAILLLSTFSQAQQKFSGGFYAGVIGSQVDGDRMAGFNKGGLNVGVTAQYPLADKLFMSLEFAYAMKGSKEKSYPGAPLYYQLKINYIDVPVMINFYDRQQIGIGLGVQYSRLVGNKKETIYPNPVGYSYKPVFVNDNDLLWVASASYYFTPQVQLNIRYCYSLRAMGSCENSLYKNFGCYNNLVEVRAGFIFGQEFDAKKKKKKEIQE